MRQKNAVVDPSTWPIGEGFHLVGVLPLERVLGHRSMRKRSVSIGQIAKVVDGDAVNWDMCFAANAEDFGTPCV